MRKKKFSSLKLRMLTYFGLLSSAMIISVVLVEMYGIPFTRFRGEYEEQRREVFQKLDFVADLQKRQLIYWLQERSRDSESIEDSNLLKLYISDLRALIRDLEQNGLRGGELWVEVRKRNVYRLVAQHLEQFVNSHEVYEFIQIVDTLSGVVIASTRDTDLGRTGFEHTYLQRLEGLSGGGEEVRFESHVDSFHLEFACLIEGEAPPGSQGERENELLILHINPDNVLNPVGDTGEGLGMTGETLLVDKEVKILTHLRHLLPDGTEAKPFDYRIRARPAVLAAAGNEGIIDAKDYRNVPVLAAYRYIPISSNMGWGMVVKIDQSEVFSSLYENITLHIIIGLLGIALVLSISYYVAARLARPINLLVDTAMAVKAGNLDERAPASGSDEVAILASAFNSMIDEVKNWRLELEEKVRVRTRDLDNVVGELKGEVEERKKLESYLRESKEKYRNLVDNAIVGVFSSTDEGEILYVNDCLARMYGFDSREELIGEGSIARYKNPGNRGVLLDNLRKHGSVSGLEVEVLTKGGETKSILINATLENGVLSGMILDVTVQKRAVKELSREASLNEAMAEVSETLMRTFEIGDITRVILDKASVLTGSDHGYVSSIDTKTKDHVPHTIAEMMDDQCKVSVDGEIISFQRGDDGTYNALWGHSLNVREPLIANDPEAHPASKGTPEGHIPIRNYLSIPVMLEGELVGQIAVANKQGGYTDDDVGVCQRLAGLYALALQRNRMENELLEGEIRFRDMLEHSPTATFILQGEDIVFKNPEVAKVIGDLPDPFTVREYQRIHPDDKKRLDEMFERLKTGAGKSLNMEFRFLPDHESQWEREIKWIICQATSIKYGEGDALLVNLMDITSSKEIEFRDRDRMASLGRVAAGIAHEIRSPLSGINILLEALKDVLETGESPDTIQTILEQIQVATDRIESVIRRTMDFSKPGRGNYALMNINASVEDAVDMLRVSLRKKGIELIKNLAEDLPPCYADKRFIGQVVINLLENASTAIGGKEGERKIAVATSGDGDRVVVRVADSGPGVPYELRETIFEPFFTTKSDSSGLGLSICKRIIADHGGEIVVGSSGWGGAEIVFSLPRERRKLPR